MVKKNIANYISTIGYSVVLSFCILSAYHLFGNKSLELATELWVSVIDRSNGDWKSHRKE